MPNEITPCLCLHGFGPYLATAADGASWELRICAAHPIARPDDAAAPPLTNAAMFIDRALCALADVVETLWCEGPDTEWSPDTIDAIAARLADYRPRPGKMR